MLLHTLYFMYLFKLEFPPDTCPRIEFLDFMVTQCFSCVSIFIWDVINSDFRHAWVVSLIVHTAEKNTLTIELSLILKEQRAFFWLQNASSTLNTENLESVSNFIQFYIIILSYYSTMHRKKGVFSRRHCLDIFPF